MPRAQLIAIMVTAGIAAVILGIVISQATNDTIDIPTNQQVTNSTIESEIEKKLDEIETDANEKDIIELEYDPARPRPWITSGPFQIDRPQYYLGEKIFLRIGGITNDEKGQVAFLRPLNATHYSVYMTVPFDGVKKPAFNYYIEPKLSKANGICSIDDLVGEWTVVFRGTDYSNIKFNVLNQTIPGMQDDFNPVC